MNYGESPPPAFSDVDDFMCLLRSDDTDEIRKPTGKVKVSKKGQTFAGFKQIFASKKKELAPNCEKEKNVSVDSLKVSVNCEGCRFSSDLTDPECRLRCARIVGREACRSLVLDNGFYKKEYGDSDTKKLKELSEIAGSLSIKFPEECGLCTKEHDEQVVKLRDFMLKDPIGLLHNGVEVSDNEEITVRGIGSEICQDCRHRTEDVVSKALLRLEKSGIVKGYNFSPMVRPFFSTARVLFETPKNVESSYENNGSKVFITGGEEEVYNIFPPEYRLGKRQLKILKLAYVTAIKKAGSLDERQFASHCRSEIITAASKLGYNVQEEELKLMAESLLRCTTGLDVIELLLKDPNLQDVYINSPIDTTPLYVKHNDFDDCRTNVYISEQAARNIISKFRLKSGRAFSEVSPILDMELPEFGVRVNITGPPVSPDGLAFAFRRASEEPWTLLRFIENRMISPLAAGLLGMMVNEESAILMCGDRGSGKTSMLTALVSAMPSKYRILTMEDTFEIPVPILASEGGFRIQRMRIRPPTARESFELGADDAMRSLLRMGDSAIVMGEVRGAEARTLYEAMNVGGSGNCVLGTIHGKSPRSLLERVVFSLGVPPQSFKATDLVVIADRIRPGGGSRKLRRVTEIVEVGKSWKEPDAEQVFSQLMRYDQDSDMLVASEKLLKPKESEVICKIASKRGVEPEVILKDIETRAAAYAYAVGLFRKTSDRKLLAMKAMIGLNQKYLQLVDESIAEFGRVDYGFVAEGVKEWLDDYAKNKIRIEIAENGLREAVQGLAKDI